jgi:hypothetical protein
MNSLSKRRNKENARVEMENEDEKKERKWKKKMPFLS